MKSLKTTTAGVAGILATIANIVKQISEHGVAGLAQIDWTAAMTSLALSWGLLCARDHNVTSEQAGLKPLARTLGLILVAALTFSLVGCASTTTRQREVTSMAPDGTTTETRDTTLKSRTFFDSKSELAKARLSTTDKTQGVTISGLSNESSGSNAVQMLKIVVEAAAPAAKALVAP